MGMPITNGPLELQIMTAADSISIIKRAFGPKVSTRHIATHLARDLILMDSLPFQIDQADGWWLVSSAKDWLLQPDGTVSLRNFRQIVHFPEAGREACHTEVVLTAFADAVVTSGRDGDLTWITGEADQWTLPAKVLECLRDNSGRVVAFTSRDD
jgi:hypothetical protein